MNDYKKLSMNLFLSLALIMAITTSCYKEQVVAEESTVTPGEGLADWTTETHSNEANADYDVVFPQEKVNRVDLVIDSDKWDAMLKDLNDNIGTFGSGGNMPPIMFSDFEGGFPPPPPVSEGNFPGDPPGGEGEVDFTPVFKSASVFFNGIEWYHVGVRFKGNSSLRSAWQSGIMKLAFRFDFDEFEDDYPEIKNQRFYGFQKIAFSNNFDDQSFLHEKVAADIFRSAGLKAPQTAYYRIYVDYGDGPIYFGLYTAVEIVEDTMIKDQFGNGEGNCYKPEGDAATFAAGTYDISEFDLKTNEDMADYSDVESLYDIINSNVRTTDVEQWKSELEAVFDVDHFLHWLAVNTVIQNWDTYGVMSHNYYLYNNPYTNKLVWIPWDNNEALTDGKKEPLPLSMDKVDDNWPLIRYIIDQDEYKAIYESYLNETIENAFNPITVKETYLYYHNLIQDYVIGSEGEQTGYTFLNSSADFINSLSTQNNHVDIRHDAVIDYLSK